MVVMLPRLRLMGLALVAALVATAAVGAAIPDGPLDLEFLANADAGNGRGLVVDGDHAYVSGTDGLSVVDVSDPTNPSEVAESVSGRDVEILEYPSRTVAVVAAQYGGMLLVDVTNPSNPIWISRVLADSAVHNVGVAPGTHLVYAPTGSAGALSPSEDFAIVDASDPNDPDVLRRDHTELPCHDIEFDADQDRAFCPGLTATEIWDVSDPRNPTVVSTIANPAINLHHWATTAKGGDLLVIGDEFAGAASDGCVARSEAQDPAGDASDPVGALWFYDISNEEAPVPLSWVSAQSAGGPLSQGGLGDSCTAHFGEVLPGGDKIVTGWYKAGTKIVDVTDPLTPEITETFRKDASNAWDARYADGSVFTGDRQRGLDVLDVRAESFS
jgi:hypothetical protein